MSQLGRKEALVAAAAIGIAIIVWNFRDRISKFLFGLCEPLPPSQPSVSSESTAKSAPEAMELDSPKSSDSRKTSAEKVEEKGAPEPNPAQVAPEAMEEKAKSAAPSVYVGLPKADPSTVSSAIPPPQWPGATPL